MLCVVSLDGNKNTTMSRYYETYKFYRPYIKTNLKAKHITGSSC